MLGPDRNIFLTTNQAPPATTRLLYASFLIKSNNFTPKALLKYHINISTSLPSLTVTLKWLHGPKSPDINASGEIS